MQLRIAGSVLGAILLTGCNIGGPPQPHVHYDPANPGFYTQDVLPIFRSNCFRCHGGMNRKGMFNMQTRAAMLRGGKHGTALVPGDPAASLLVRLIRHEGPKDNPMPMPDKRKRLSDEEIGTIERWIKAGAIMPPESPTN